MSIPIIISYFVALIWILIPFRQRKTNYFFFFLFNAIGSLIITLNLVLFLYDIIFVHNVKIFFGLGLFLIISLFNFKKIPHYLIFLLTILAISIVLPFFLSVNTIMVLLVLQNIIIFVIFLKHTVAYSSAHEKLNLFHFILLFYQMTVILRFILLLGDINTAGIFFYISAFFSAILGIFFLIFNENSSPKLSLKSD